MTPRWLLRLKLRAGSLLRRRELDDQLAAEMAFHLAELKAEFLAAGMGEKEAESAARREFGGVAALAEQ